MRSTTLDLIRIVAIYLVIVVHTFQFPSEYSSSSILNLLFYALAKTCVPLFLLLSGGLLLAKKETAKLFFKKRFFSVIIPWVSWSIVGVLFAVWKFHQPFQLSNITTMMQSFWFVVMIICLYLITPVLRPMIQSLSKSQLMYLVGVWFVAVSLLPHLYNSLAFPMSVDNGLVRQTISYSGIYIAGYLLLHKWSWLLKKSYLVAGALLIVGLLLSIGFTWLKGSPETPLTDTYFNFYAPGPVLSAVGLFLLLYKLFSRYAGKLNAKISQRLVVVSSLSLHAYFFHDILRRYVFTAVGSSTALIAYLQALGLFALAMILLLLGRSLMNLRR